MLRLSGSCPFRSTCPSYNDVVFVQVNFAVLGRDGPSRPPKAMLRQCTYSRNDRLTMAPCRGVGNAPTADVPRSDSRSRKLPSVCCVGRDARKTLGPCCGSSRCKAERPLTSTHVQIRRTIQKYQRARRHPLANGSEPPESARVLHSRGNLVRAVHNLRERPPDTREHRCRTAPR